VTHPLLVRGLEMEPWVLVLTLFDLFDGTESCFILRMVL
jgi:hypothetical protein